MPDVSVPGINWTQVTPEERARLNGLIEYYRKKPKPFTACVRDNTKRFGPERARRICAVLKDLIEGGTDWRKGGRKMAEAEALSIEELREVLDRAEEIMGERQFAYNPSQARAPKGTSIGGRWIAILARAEAKKNDLSDKNDVPVDADDIPVAEELAKRGELRKVSDRTKSYEITAKGQRRLAAAKANEPAPGDPGSLLRTIRDSSDADLLKNEQAWRRAPDSPTRTRVLEGILAERERRARAGRPVGRALPVTEGGERQRKRIAGKDEPRESGASERPRSEPFTADQLMALVESGDVDAIEAKIRERQRLRNRYRAEARTSTSPDAVGRASLFAKALKEEIDALKRALPVARSQRRLR